MIQLNSFEKESLVSLKVDLYRGDHAIEGKFLGEIKRDPWEFPTQKIQAKRVEDLWKSTCFECFLFPESLYPYGEWNFSPSGDWCVFLFNSYRVSSGRIIEDDRFLRSKFSQSGNKFELQFEISGSSDSDLARLLKEPNLWVWPTAVIENQGHLSYWAIKHLKTKPDFHQFSKEGLKL